MLSTNGSWQVDPVQGAVRFWYSPTYSSAALGGSGPANPACLLALVSTNGSAGGIWTSLVVSSDGNELDLLCESQDGLSTCLSAPIAWQAGSWNLVAVCFSETNSAIFINGGLAAAGGGLASVPAQLAPFTSLVIGSDLSGNCVAAGQFDELYTFSGQGKFAAVRRLEFGLSRQFSITNYYGALSPTAALGPVTDAELAAQRPASALPTASLTSPALVTTMGSFSTTDCTTNLGAIYLTNVTCVFDTNAGWTVSLQLVGTNGNWDIFGVTNLGVPPMNTWPWFWATNANTCDLVSMTNQPNAQCFYLAGDASDPDGDGLGTAFELLISHSDPNLYSTRGDGLSDKVAYLQGRNPRVPGSLPDPGTIQLEVYTPSN
jgi:hypothetical protein